MIKLYEENKKEEEKDVYLRLRNGSNYIILYACDKEGNELSAGNLLRFYKDGRVVSYGGISHNIEFKLDSNSHLKIT